MATYRIYYTQTVTAAVDAEAESEQEAREAFADLGPGEAGTPYGNEDVTGEEIETIEVVPDNFFHSPY